MHYLNWGNHLAEIKWRGAYNLIHPSQFQRFEESTRGKLYYIITEGFDEANKPKERKIAAQNILHVPNLGEDLWGLGVVEHAKNTIGLDFAAEKFGSKFFKAGGSPPGLMKVDKAVTQKQLDDIKKFYKTQMSDGGTLTVPAGVDYQQIVLPPEAMQFLGTRQFSVLEIARWYGVPPEKLAELNRATYGNIEHNSLAFLADTVAPILAAFENEYTNKLLEDGYYFEFDMNAYLRADTMAKAEHYRTGIQNSYLTINEVRQKENLPTVEDGERLVIQSNMVHTDRLDEIIGKAEEINIDENE